MKRSECSKCNVCAAPLCPLDPSSIEHGTWYIDEDVCTKTRFPFPKPRWLTVQKRIRKRAFLKLRRDPIEVGWFSVRMLEKLAVVYGANVRGLPPEVCPLSERESNWIRKRKGPRELSDADRAVLRERGLKNLVFLKQRRENATQ